MRPPILDREEYIEQAYFFRVYRERLQENVPSQEILQTIQEEILATTRLPMAIDLAIVLGFCGSMMSLPFLIAVTTGLHPSACAE